MVWVWLRFVSEDASAKVGGLTTNCSNTTSAYQQNSSLQVRYDRYQNVIESIPSEEALAGKQPDASYMLQNGCKHYPYSNTCHQIPVARSRIESQNLSSAL